MSGEWTLNNGPTGGAQAEFTGVPCPRCGYPISDQRELHHGWCAACEQFVTALPMMPPLPFKTWDQYRSHYNRNTLLSVGIGAGGNLVVVVADLYRISIGSLSLHEPVLAISYSLCNIILGWVIGINYGPWRSAQIRSKVFSELLASAEQAAVELGFKTPRPPPPPRGVRGWYARSAAEAWGRR